MRNVQFTFYSGHQLIYSCVTNKSFQRKQFPDYISYSIKAIQRVSYLVKE